MITVKTNQRNELVDITDIVQKHVPDEAKAVIVSSPHTTCGVTINDGYDPDVKSDMLNKLSELIPKDQSYYQHDEGNSDSHVKTSLVGNAITIPIEDGQLLLGQWQTVYLAEFDGPRTRTVHLTFL